MLVCAVRHLTNDVHNHTCALYLMMSQLLLKFENGEMIEASFQCGISHKTSKFTFKGKFLIQTLVQNK